MIPPHAKVRPIIALVAEHYGFTLDDVLTHDKSRSIDRARAVAFFVARQITNATYAELGTVFQRDHCTARHGCLRVAEWMTKDETFAAQVKAIIAKLTGVGPQPRDCSGLVYGGAGCTEVRA